ncbi:hypothetical protein BBUCA112A_D0024 (plasmid) [Borreliella burgdorferi CA-11.2A]|nr:hypothetical protein BBU64B_D0020 [Borreliella burgdorferi 64b]ACN56212.1 hypothetical protein BBUCA112A_D0024 [Borreliella burgdorferi CA-11.2A]ACN92330.1 hypothetical protein BBU94A_D22 [Borreliella burgdorferi 94a]
MIIFLVFFKFIFVVFLLLALKACLFFLLLCLRNPCVLSLFKFL